MKYVTGQYKTTYLLLLISSQLKVLTPLDGQLFPKFAACTFHLQCDLLCGLGLQYQYNEWLNSKRSLSVLMYFRMAGWSIFRRLNNKIRSCQM